MADLGASCRPTEGEEATKPGHWGVLIFLVDLTQRVLSAMDVAPHQCEWVTKAMHSTGQVSTFKKLSVILNVGEGVMTCFMEAEKLGSN